MSAESASAQLSYDRSKYGANRQDLDAMGERDVKEALNSGKYSHIKHDVGLSPFEFVSAWLADAEFLRLSEAEANRSAREAETLAIAKEANSIARSAAASASEANAIARLNSRRIWRSETIAAIAAIAAIVAAIKTY